MEKNSGTLRGWLSNPWVGGIGVLASLVGVGLSIYFYFLTEKRRNLIFTASDGVTIVDAQRSGRLAVYADGKKVEGGVSSVNILFWNEGREAIKTQDFLSPLEIVFPKGNRIIETRFRFPSRRVTGVALDETNSRKGILGITWRILEKDDFGAIQIIFEGGPEIRPVIRGVFEGQRTIKVQREEFSERNSGMIIFISIAVLIFMVIFTFEFRSRPALRDNLLAYKLWLSIGLLLLVTTLWMIKRRVDLPPAPPASVFIIQQEYIKADR